MATAGKDKFVNYIKKAITMSAANTLTFEDIDIGLNLFDKIGLLIHRIAYYVPQDTLTPITGDSDEVGLAIVGNDNVSTINPDDRWVIDSMSLHGLLEGTAANFLIEKMPIVHDFSNLPGGGLLVPPKPLSFAMDTNGFAAAVSAKCVIMFTIMQLKDADYFELLESFRFFD